MRPETHDETLAINAVWIMARHTVCDGCGRYVQTNAQALCRKCARKVLMVIAAEKAGLIEGPQDDDLSYYDQPNTHTQENTDAQVTV